MASVMGFTKKGGMPSKTFNPRFCGICNEPLEGEGTGEATYQLNCKHLFHDFCIRGWTLIGKKDTCPFCSEKVTLKANFRAPWEVHNQSVMWAHLLDSVRYLIVWNPVIIAGVQVIFNVFGLE